MLEIITSKDSRLLESRENFYIARFSPSKTVRITPTSQEKIAAFYFMQN